MDQDTVEQDPNFHGYDSTGSFVPEGDKRARSGASKRHRDRAAPIPPRTRKYYRDSGLQFTPAELSSDAGAAVQRQRA